MRWLEKLRHIFASDKNYSKRDKAGLARNSLWDGVYDRSKTPKDGWAQSQKIIMKRTGNKVTDSSFEERGRDE